MKHTQIWHVQRKEIKLRTTPAFLISGNYIEICIVADKIYFYNDDFGTGDEFRDPTLEIDEYDYNGKFLHSYTIEDTEDSSLTFTDDLVILNSDNVTHKEDAIRIYKLERGRAHLIRTLNDNLICQQKTVRSCYTFEKPFKMFGRYILPTSTCGTASQFLLLDIQSGNVLNEITTSDLHLDFCPNWNLEEFGMMYVGNRMRFKIVRKKNANPDLSLKHQSRLTCLTSFTQEYLAQQNIPSILLDYMEVEH